MKKITLLIFVMLSIGAMGMGLLAHKAHKSEIIKKEATPVSESQDGDITVDKLNIHTGLYKTYDDFVKNKPQKLRFIGWRYQARLGGGGFKYLEATFSDEKGKRTNMACSEFWGFRSNGGLYRSFPFENGDVNFVCYRLEALVNKTYVWTASTLSTINLEPAIITTDKFNGKANGGKVDESKGELECYFTVMQEKASEKTPRPKWSEFVRDLKKCSNVKFALDRYYGAVGEITYLKHTEDEIKEYTTINS